MADTHLVVDNYSTHKTASIKSWLTRHPRLHAHFTPTSASWLDQVKRCSSRSRSAASVVSLERAIGLHGEANKITVNKSDADTATITSV